MSWFTPLAGLKKKICRYLLQRYLGQFLEEKLNLEQLNVDLYNGTGSVSNVALNCEALNEICENQGWGIEVTGGHIGSITVTVPWNALMTDDSSIEVKQLFISIKPLPRQNDGTSMFESMWSSMSNSMQLARECLGKDNDDDIQINEQNTTIEGLEKFAQTIDSILNRIKAKFIDTEIRLEYLPSNSDCGLAIIVKIDRLDYQNEAGGDPSDDIEESKSSDEHSKDKKIHLLSTYATHRISFEGITFYTKEFRAVNISLKQQESEIESLICSKQFYSITSQLPETQKHLFSDNLNVSKEIDLTKSIVMGTDITENQNENENEIKIYSSESIMIMRIDGKQEIYIKMKQFENVYGPKVHLEMQLGRISLFISPRQLHLIMKFFNLFFSNDQQQQQQQQQLLQNKIDNDNAELLSKRQNELQKIQKCYSSMSGIIAANEGFWSEPGNEAKLIQQTALKSINNTVCGGGGGAGGTFSSALADDYCESINSSMTSSSTTNSLRFRHKSQNIGSNGDISYFNFRIASVIIVLLHEDILLENSISNDNPLSKESVSKLISLSEEFFNNIDDDIKLINSPIISCTKNHLELNLKPIIMEGEQQRNNNVIILKATLSITKIDFDEILQNYSIPLIKFKREELVIGGIHKRPEFILTLKTNSSRKLSNSKMDKKDICLKLESCIIEFDITLYDRLNSILGPSPFNVVTSSASFSDIDVISPTTIQSETVTGTSSSSSTTTKNRHYESNTTELKLEAPNLDIHLRFPIVDTRPLHDPNRIPWWKQNIRSDFLLFSIQLFRLNYSHSTVEIMANKIDLFYCNNNDSPKIHIGKTNLISTKGNGMNMNQSSIEYPRISINFPFDKSFVTLSKLNIDDSDSGETSGESCALFSKSPKEYLPFSSKRVCRQSDTPHIKTDIDEAETILLPGESEEMKKFCELSTKTSKLQIKVSLPTASLQINSKHLYEVLYNRLNTDLLMWEPIAPNLSNKSKNSINSTPIIDQCLSNVGMMDSMYIPSPSSTSAKTSKKKLHRDNNESSSLESSDISAEENESDNDGDDNNDDSDDHNLYYSAYDRKRFSKRYHHHHQLKQNTSNRNRLQLSACSFELEIGNGILTLYAPVRDTENRVLPEQLGEFILKANKFNLFSVNGYRGNVNLAYLCIQLKSIEAYHCGLISNIDNDIITPSLRLYTNEMPSYIQATLYPTQKNSTLSNNSGSMKREMLSFAVEIKKNPEQRLKRLKITTGIQNTTLKHNPAITQHTWLNQIIDMFDVVDYPIEGYKPYSILAEMQLHLWDCAIDYRPLNFAFRAIAEIGTLMISSNLTTTTAGCTLRFIAEECILSLAPYDFISNRNIPKNKIMSLPSKELISILDLGLLDISLRLNEKATELFPKFDLRSSIQDMHIRTCSDSGRALAHLIAYIANDGDLTISNEKDMEQEKHDIENEGSLLSVKECSQIVPEITEKQQERVNTLMAEALQETDNIAAQKLRYDDELKSNRSVEVFFFPDESQQLKKLKEEKHFVKTDQKSKDTISINDDSISTSTLELSASQSHEKKSNITPDADCLILDTDGASGGGVAGSSVNSDEWNFDRESTGSELRDLLNFETSVMYNSYNLHDEVVEALPEIREELGEINITKSKLVNEKKTRRNSFNLEDDFCFISEEDKAYMSKCGKEVEISNDPLRIVDNHFSLPMGKSDLLKAPENFPMAVMRYTLCEMTVTWHLYGGHDFPLDDEKLPNKSDDDDSMMFLKPMSETYKTGVSYSKSQQTVQFNNKKPTAKTSWKTKGGFKRNHDVLIEIMLTKVKLSHEIYPKHTTQASRQVIVVSELEIRDRLQTSEINKFLYHPLPRHLSNKSSQHMIVIKALHVRPNPILLTQECSLRISLLPLRLNIDQDALLFLVQFFNELSSTENDDDNSLNKRNTTTKETQPPVMMVDDIPESVQDFQARQMISKNLNLLMDDEQPKDKIIEKQPPTTIVQESTNNLPIYFKEIIFSPDVLIRLDYHGRRIEMSRGPIAGLLMGLGQLQCSEIRLKKIFHRHGILGLDRLLNFLLQEWLQDIKKNQLPSILSGVGPMYTFVQLFQGIRDLFWLPIEQYQKDGRIVRGLQLGAQSFTARTALAALEITARIIQLLQITAETAFDMVSPGPSVRRIRNNRKGKRKRPHRPQDIREGVANAYQIVKEGINETANTLIETTVAEHDQKGYTGAVGAVFRQIPPIALRPVVLATQATTNVLGGVKSQLVPDARFEAKEKWKNDTD